ncbi:MAG TPA: hypothetical protein VLA16_19535 [Ideonella sp.]|nr:hypothetical protein [Ideonella sp.]
MNRKTWLLAAASALLFASAGAASAQAVAGKTTAIYDTTAPGGWLGFNGFDIYQDQRVAARFTAPADGDMRLARIGIWFMNNSDTVRAKMRISLQTDTLDDGGEATMPSGKVLEKWVARVATLGWSPVEQFFTTTKLPRLKAGHSYWVVAESMADFQDPVWLFASQGLQVNTVGHADGVWYPGGEAGALTLHVDAVPAQAE